MRRVLVGALALLVAGCGSQATGPALSPVVADASRVDMCTILTDAELTGLGFDVDSRKPFDKVGVIGCGWHGKVLTLGLDRDTETIASYKARRHGPAFTSFGDDTVNGRAGVHLSVDRERDDCTQLIDG
ncbi:MAG: DUF3558 family protein, partial [Pseudonocardiaceae bacterium]